MDKLTTVEKMLNLVDMLTTEVDNYVQEHEALRGAYEDLLNEKEDLCDVIARLVNERDRKKK